MPLSQKWGGSKFGLFKSAPLRDAQLGELRRSGRLWKGSIVLAQCGTFPLSLAGGREAPDPLAVKLAKELPGQIQAMMPKIENGLFNLTLQRLEVPLNPVNPDGERVNQVEALGVFGQHRPRTASRFSRTSRPALLASAAPTNAIVRCRRKKNSKTGWPRKPGRTIA
jgi:hypothetical protein